MSVFIRFACILLLALATGTGAAHAHFSQGAQQRVIAFEDGPGGGALIVYTFTPAPLVFADEIARARNAQSPLASPYLRLEQTGAGARYRITSDAVRAAPDVLAARVANALDVRTGAERIAAGDTELRVILKRPATRPASAADIAALLEGDIAPGLDPVFGDAIIVARTVYPDIAAQAELHVSNPLPVIELPPNVSIDNHIIDERFATMRELAVDGQLQAGVAMDGSLWRTLTNFTWQGVLHIVKGLDHVFLVVCMALAVTQTRRLLWLVTAFTLGHSVTLVTSFLGYVPSGDWFIPAVEALIAITVLYAAWCALRRRMDHPAILAGVGLLHGMGFAFVLSEILSPQSAQLIPSLFAFNVGIEIGQLAIIAAVLVGMAGLRFLGTRAPDFARQTALFAIAGVALYWSVERSVAVVGIA
ncbi:MAG: HupE/UreJ family protein [Pseudomonadota bacterium]